MNQSMATGDGGGGMWTTKSAHRWSLAGPWLFFSAAPQTPTVGCGAGEGRGGAGVDSPTIASFICVCCIKEHRNGRNFSSSLGDGNEVTVPWIPMGVTKYCLIGRVPQHCTQTKNSVRNVKNTKKKNRQSDLLDRLPSRHVDGDGVVLVEVEETQRQSAKARLWMKKKQKQMGRSSVLFF